MNCNRCGAEILGTEHNIKIRRCAPCHARAQREYNQRNRDRLNALRREQRAKKGDMHRAYERDYRATRADIMREQERARRYNMTVDELRELFDSHDGTCGICGGNDPHDGRWGQWSVDHCHSTGRVRGILCGKCNKSIGLMADDPARLRAAAAYLEGSLADI